MLRVGKKLLIALMMGCGVPGGTSAAPDSVLGRDFCADQMVLAFADRGQILALSKDAQGPHSFFAKRAVGLPTSPGSAEDILWLRPDLVIRSWGGDLATDALFARTGIDILQPPYAFTFEMSLQNFKDAAERLGVPEAGAAFMADYQARYAALEAASPIPLKAVYMTPSGFTAGEGTSVDKIVRLSGFQPAAQDFDLKGWGPLPLEKLVLSPPEVVIGSFFEEGAVHVSHWSSGRHGVFRGLIGDLPTIMVPSRFMSCSGPFAVDAAEFIRAEARRLGLISVSADEELE